MNKKHLKDTEKKTEALTVWPGQETNFTGGAWLLSWIQLWASAFNPASKNQSPEINLSDNKLRQLSDKDKNKIKVSFPPTRPVKQESTESGAGSWSVEQIRALAGVFRDAPEIHLTGCKPCKLSDDDNKKIKGLFPPARVVNLEGSKPGVEVWGAEQIEALTADFPDASLININ